MSSHAKIRAFLDIPDIQGKIALTGEITYIGKLTIRNSTNKALDAAFLSPISRIKKDPQTDRILKQQCMITFQNGQFYIEDQNTTNGTYLNGENLKLTTPQLLRNGSQIIIPVEKNGQLNQLKLIFRVEGSSVISPPQKPKSITEPTLGNPHEEINNPPIVDQTISSISSSGGTGQSVKYVDPTRDPTVSPSGSDTSQDQSLLFYHSQIHDSTKSFIVFREKVKLPKDAFDHQVSHRFGLDLSMFYRLEWKQWVHIFIGYLILVLMSYRTQTNILLLDYGFREGWDNIFNYSNEIFLEPLYTALIFGFVFIIHELSHVGMGNKLDYPSRLITAFIGIPIALPGAAVSLGLDPNEDVNSMGKIKVAGPLSNVISGWIIFLIAFATKTILPTWLMSLIIPFGIFNFSLGIFNMIPTEFGSFALDGKFIFKWKKGLYLLLLLTLIGGYVFVILIFPESFT